MPPWARQQGHKGPMTTRPYGPCAALDDVVSDDHRRRRRTGGPQGTVRMRTTVGRPGRDPWWGLRRRRPQREADAGRLPDASPATGDGQPRVTAGARRPLGCSRGGVLPRWDPQDETCASRVAGGRRRGAPDVPPRRPPDRHRGRPHRPPRPLRPHPRCRFRRPLRSGRVPAWAQVTIRGHAPQRRVSRIGNPVIRPLLLPVPRPEVDALNAGGPDPERHQRRLSHPHLSAAGMAVSPQGRPTP